MCSYAWHGELVPLIRQRGRAWPICCAREWPRYRWTRLYDGREVALGRYDAPKGEPYSWCPEKGRWGWGEMTVCSGHAAQMALGITVAGIPLNGQWSLMIGGGLNDE